ncbi:MAG: hypothetical protein OXD00_02750 [Gammaproteobacteria bacterium]|nr:hypothetical protein [Gammaproteobacteria bacterium]
MFSVTLSEAIAFDTHRFVKRLTGTGFTEAQAEALADEQVHLLNSNMATKQNLQELEGIQKQQLIELQGEQRQQLTRLEGRLQQQMAELKADLLKWMIGALIAQTGVIVGLVLGFTGS